MDFQPDYRHMLAVLANRRPARLPIYEHIGDVLVMEKSWVNSIPDYVPVEGYLAMIAAAGKTRANETSSA